MDSVFSQICVLGSSLVLMFGLILLWRRGVTAYITAFKCHRALGDDGSRGVLRR